MLLYKRVAKGQLGLDLVVVPPSVALTQDVALLDQLGEDFVGASLRDSDRGGDVAQADAGILTDAEQDVGVVREEVPAGRRFACLLCHLLKNSRMNIHEWMIHCLY